MTNRHNTEIDLNCILCNSDELVLVKSSNIDKEIKSEFFSITDYHYGKTDAIFKCRQCGHLQCSNIVDPLLFYETLEDREYEESRNERTLQMRNILDIVKKYKTSGSMLDIGAASGILVELAIATGFSAKGIEPSRTFYKNAIKRNLPLHLGTFPHPEIKEAFDVITLIDVIEHVPDPITLLKNISGAMKDNGIGVLVTPDVSSVTARIMGWKWWHFRVAHINYFNRKTLLLALDRAGLVPVIIIRPKWFFSVDYLFKRMMRYFPQLFRISCPKLLQNTIIPLNLFDSILVVFKKIEADYLEMPLKN